MTLKNRLVNELILREGGYINHPNDRGGATRYGITLRVAMTNGYIGDMKQFPIEKAKEIYIKGYWDRNQLDDMVTISEKITEEIFDTSVNMGTLTAGRFLQRCLNVLNVDQNTYDNLRVDGNIGNKTLSALADYITERGDDGEIVLLRMLNSLQGARYIALAERDKKQELFIFGWFKNRVAI
jgi:lysozyme family protein